jgi:hypothetical protein
MTKAWTRTLFNPAKDPSAFGSIVAWWELRRIPFNLLVGAVGIVSFIVYAWLSISYGNQFGEGDDFNPGLSVTRISLIAS